MLLVLTPCLHAATYTWDGGGSNGNWNQAGNWNPDGAPGSSSGHDLIFGGTTRTSNNANGGGWTINSIAFNSTAGAFTLDGSGLTLGGGGITNNSTSTQTINNQFTLSADQTWTAASGAIVTGTAYFNANSKDLTLAGSSAITINNQIGGADVITTTGSGNRTFGTQQIAANTVNVQSTGTNSFGGQINATTLNVSAGTSTFANVQAGTGGINVSGAANANFTGPVAGGSGSGITLSGSGNIDFSGSITGGTLTLTSAFTGTATLSGSGSKNISSTVVSGGTLIMDQAGGGDAINGSLTINNGGTVIFTGDNQVPSWQTVYLNEGSTLLLGDTTQTITNLVITGDSVIDFGGNGSQLNISSNITITEDITITILNWNDEAGDVFMGSNPGPDVVVTIQYADNDGNIYATGTYGGGGITPGSPVPEPATYGLLMLGYGAGLVLLRRRKR